MRGRESTIKDQRKTVTIILLAAGLVCLIISFLIQDNEARNLMRIIGLSLIGAIVLFRLFKSNLGYKPTLKELEDKIRNRKDQG